MDLRKEVSKVLQSFMHYVSPGMQILRHISYIIYIHILYVMSSICVRRMHVHGGQEAQFATQRGLNLQHTE